MSSALVVISILRVIIIKAIIVIKDENVFKVDTVIEDFAEIKNNYSFWVTNDVNWLYIPPLITNHQTVQRCNACSLRYIKLLMFSQFSMG